MGYRGWWSAFKPDDKTELQKALTTGANNSTTATEQYGDINTWDVSDITDMMCYSSG